MKTNYYYITCEYGGAKVISKLKYTFEGDFDFDHFNDHIINIAVEQIKKYVAPLVKKEHVIAIPSLVHQS